MAEIDLIKKLENISLMIPNRVLKLQGYLFRKDSKEFLEIIMIPGNKLEVILMDSKLKVVGVLTLEQDLGKR